MAYKLMKIQPADIIQYINFLKNKAKHSKLNPTQPESTYPPLLPPTFSRTTPTPPL
jgi:hypothetical protein